MARNFVDGLKDVFVLGNVARLEFFELIPHRGQAEDGTNRVDISREQALTVAMPIEALSEMVGMLERIRDNLKSKPAATNSAEESSSDGESFSFKQ